jgi:hypothetical protein
MHIKIFSIHDAMKQKTARSFVTSYITYVAMAIRTSLVTAVPPTFN